MKICRPWCTATRNACRGGDTERWDVVVVGAGPAGSTTATVLARAGLRVLLLDKAANGPPAKVCGEYLSPGCLPLLQRLGVFGSLREAGHPLYGMLIHTPAGRMVCAAYPGGGDAPHERVYGLSVPRAHLDPVLLDLAIKSGAVFESGFQVSDVSLDGALVEVRGRLHGRETRRPTQLVVGADGRHSIVARRLGSVRRNPWLDKMALVAYLEGAQREDDFGEIFLGRDRYAILNPIAKGLTNLGVVVNRRDLPAGEDPRQSLWPLAKSLPGLGERLRTATLVAPVRCLGPLAHRAAQLSGSRALLVGDAAGFLDPFTGEGIYAALRSGELAARRVLSAWTSAGPHLDALGAYAHAWQQEVDPKWRLATHLQRAIRHPPLAEGMTALLSRRPALAATLLAAAGDLIPPAHLSLGRLLLRGATRKHSQR